MLLVGSHVVFSNIGGYVVIISQYKASYKGYKKFTLRICRFYVITNKKAPLGQFQGELFVCFYGEFLPTKILGVNRI